MGWSCRRPGCSQPAAFSITYDAVNCQVWISSLAVDDLGQLLCQQHRQRLSPPRGWVVIDRAVEPQVAQAAAVAREVEPPERAWGQLLIDEPVFTTDPRAAAAPILQRSEAQYVEPENVETGLAQPVVPEPEDVGLQNVESTSDGDDPGNDDPGNDNPDNDDPDNDNPGNDNPGNDNDDPTLGSLLAPKGGLLGRAFRATGHQRSVLTEGITADVDAEAEA